MNKHERTPLHATDRKDDRAMFPKNLLTLEFWSHIHERVLNDEIRQSTLQAMPFWVAAAIAALFAVGYAKLFLWLEELCRSFYGAHPYWSLLVSPLGFVAGWALVRYFAPEAGGSGIPQLMAATELDSEKDEGRLNRLLGLRMALVKTVSSGLCVVSGGAIGREGPTLQLSGSAFYFVSKRLPKFWPSISHQSMIIAGGAAGLAAAFNTPLGGIVYVIEELSSAHLSVFRTAVLQVVIVAGLIAQLILGPYLYLGYPPLSPMPYEELPIAVLVGAIAGLAGALFGRLLLTIVESKDRLPGRWTHAAVALGCGFLFAGLFLLTGPVALGSGKDAVMALLFKGEKADFLWVMARAIGSVISYASGTAGGIFAPSLATGACIGSFLAQIVEPSNAQLIVLLGMVAFLTGVTRTPFTSFVLVLEMTDRHSAIFPMMIAAFSAYAFAKVLGHESFYEHVKNRYLARFARERESKPHET
jgi:H+/Cl- antiporter ClcA